MDLRSNARQIFDETRRRVGLAQAINKHVRCRAGVLNVDKLAYQLGSFRRIVLIAMGKAAVPMTEEVTKVLQNSLSSSQILDGVVVGATLPNRRHERFRYFLGSHPSPDKNSVIAANAVLELLSECDEACLVLLLVSGGASSMVEKPLHRSMDEQDAAELHRALVRSGLPIERMNTLRKHFSAVKGGRLALAARGATLCTLIVSDVPPSAIHAVGSGPSLPDPSTVQDCRAIIQACGTSLHLTERLDRYFKDPELCETPKEDDSAFHKAKCFVLLSSDDMCSAALESATQCGFDVTVDNACDEWNFRDAAKYLLDRVLALHKERGRVCLLSAGEISVPLRNGYGVGGRNQHFVLECARLIGERDLNVAVFSAGSDGIDGNSPAAGAMADSSTLKRAGTLGLSPTDALAAFDSHAFFAALGDAVMIGPTGNNLRDLRILVADE